MKTERIHIKVEPELHKAVLEKAKKNRRSVSDEVRHILKAWVEDKLEIKE